MAETGTHKELMLKNGDYAKLYNIQASAFLPEASKEKVSNVEKIRGEEPDPLVSPRYLPQEIWVLTRHEIVI